MAFNILILDPARWRVWFAGANNGTRLQVKQWAAQEEADLCFNLTTFSMATGRPDTFVRVAWKDLCYGHEGHTALVDLGSGYQCRGYSNGIVDGTVTVNRPMGGSRTRNGIGLTAAGHVIIAQTGHKVTEKVFCQTVKTFVERRGQKVKTFVLQDGGGSTAEYSSVSRLNFAPEGGRPVPTVVCVKRRDNMTLTRPIYQGCTGGDSELVQILLGGIECDQSFMSGSVKRLKQAQAALGMPSALCCGIASAYTARKMGLKSTI